MSNLNIVSPPPKTPLVITLATTFFINVDLIALLTILPSIVNESIVSGFGVASAISLRAFVNGVSVLLLPPLLSRLSSEQCLLISALMKAIAFITLAMSPTFFGLCAFAIIGGAGAGITRPALRSILHTVGEHNIRATFQWFFVAVNLAYVFGPLVADRVLNAGIESLALYIFAGGEVVMAVLVYASSPKVFQPMARIDFVRAAKDVLIDPLLLRICLYNILVSFVMSFLLAFYILYEVFDGKLASFRIEFLTFEGIAVLFCYFILLKTKLKLESVLTYRAIAILFLIGLLGAFTQVYYLVVAGLFFFAAAECLAFPQVQVEIDQAKGQRDTKVVMSVVSATAVIGEVVGSMLVGVLVLPELRHNAFLIAQVVGVVVAICFFYLGSEINSRRSKHTTQERPS